MVKRFARQWGQSAARILRGFALLSFVALVGLPAAAFAQNKQAVANEGTALEVLLPVAGAYCAYRNEDFVSYATRFAGQEITIEAAKRAAGNSNWNQRPDGNSNGIMSGHTGAAVFGASYLNHRCISAPVGRALVDGLAVYVGYSRVAADRHTIGQVLAGALVGYAFENLSVDVSSHQVAVKFRYNF